MFMYRKNKVSEILPRRGTMFAKEIKELLSLDYLDVEK